MASRIHENKTLLVFHSSEIVFTEKRCATNIVRDGEYCGTICDDTDCYSDNNDDDDRHPAQPLLNELQILFHASMLLKKKLVTVQAADINR